MLYQAQCSHDGLYAGQLYELTAEDEAHHAPSIKAGFLTRVDRPVFDFVDGTIHAEAWRDGSGLAIVASSTSTTTVDQATEPTE